MTNTPTTTKTKQSDNTNATKNFDQSKTVDRLGTVNFSNDSHQTGVVKPVLGIQILQLTAKAV